MKTLLQFAALSFGTGAGVALLASGIVAIYRGSGILNLAQGAYATVGAFSFYELLMVYRWAFAPALVCSVVFVALLGALTHLLILRQLRHASPIIRLIATLAIISIIQGVLLLTKGPGVFIVRDSFPSSVYHLDGVRIPSSQIVVFAVAVGLVVLLDALSRLTTFGLATTAVAENQRAAAALGWSPDVVAVVTWSLGCALAAVAGIFIVPFIGLEVNTFTLIVVVAMAAALLGRFTSFYLALVGGVLIEVLQSYVSKYNVTGLADGLPFFVIMVILVARGTRLPLRGHVLDHLPRIGSGAPRPRVTVLATLILGALVLFAFSSPLAQAVGQQAAVGLLLLSIVVVTGLAGQVSLGQYTIGGVGALLAGRVAQEWHWPFEAALVVGVLGAAAGGAIFAIPALRTRGISLAVVTLGLGLAVEAMVFNSTSAIGGTTGTPVGTAYLFGINIDYIEHPQRYALVCVLMFVIASLGVANIRRGRAGRRLVAIRTNERAASALGISVFESKLFAFVLSSSLAGLGGVFLGFQGPDVVYSSFDPISSINAVGYTVIGGIGFISGPIVGSFVAPGSIGSYVFDRLGVSAYWLMLVGGLFTLQILLQNPHGMIEGLSRQVGARVRPMMDRRRAAGSQRLTREVTAEAVAGPPAPPRRTGDPPRAVLELREVTVSYRGVVAVNQLNLRVRAGEVVGLIGPNGAGKTTAIDAITGYAPLAGGAIRFDDHSIDGIPVHRRSRLGLSRSFQSLELFEDLSVYENLLAASDSHDRLAYLSNLVHPGRTQLSAPAKAAVAQFGLRDHLSDLPSQLPYGRRRLVAIARALAAGPQILLLDEPAAGLDSTESAELTELIRSLASDWGLGILLVEHDMSVIMNSCERVAVIDFGYKIAEGTPDEIQADSRVIAAYLGEPAEQEAGDPGSMVVPTGGGGTMTSEPASAQEAPGPAVLSAKGLVAGYHGVPVVRDLDLDVRCGEVVALVGPNGAGKTTTLLTLAGDLPPIGGSVHLQGRRAKDPLHRRARGGLALVTEERSVFSTLTTEENLRVGRCNTAEVVEVFPELKALLKRKAWSLSGGEQQMLTLARAITRHPRVLLADELSLGLAPLVVDRLLQVLRRVARQDGVAVLIVEQHVSKALQVADRAYVMRQGVIELSGPCAQLRDQIHEIEAAYLHGSIGPRDAHSGTAATNGA